MMENIDEVGSGEQFDREVLEAELPVVVTFYADWCGDCVRLCPHVARWAGEYAGRMKFVRVEDAHRDLEDRYGVHMIPDVIVFVKGKLISRWVNVTDETAYRATFERILRHA